MAFRRLLQQPKTGLYCDGDGGWTPDDKEAFAFKDTAAAIKAALRMGEESIVLVLKFPDSRMDVIYPLDLKTPPPPKSIGGDTAGVIISLLPLAVEAAHHLKSRIH